MKSKYQIVISVLIVIVIILVFILVFYYRDIGPNVIRNHEISRSIQYMDNKKSIELVKHYYGGDMEIKKKQYGPAGTIKITAISKNDGEERFLFMLADQQHLIEGTLYSPYMTVSEINERHSRVSTSRVKMRSKLSLSKEEMKSKISKAIKEGRSSEEIIQDTTDAINARVKNSTFAKKNHNQIIANTINSNLLPKKAKLPRNNTVLDKEKIFSDIENADWISEGNSENIIYMFIDLTCSACLEVHDYLHEYINSGKIQVRYLPVGALGPDALLRASLTLMPENNEARLKLLKLLTGKDSTEGLIKDFPIAPAESQAQGHRAALRNFNILVSTKRVATPTFAYRVKGVSQINILTSKEQLRQVIQNLNE